MKATGIVVEYNPFHNGHLYHARQSKIETGADVIIAVMSGQFLQRGEPAFADKWTRTEMALLNGIDIVIELPYVYATAQASDFAKGAIALLSAIGCESFCFGSEEGAIHPFLRTYELLNGQREQYEQKIHEAVQTGISYPKAMNRAYNALTGNSDGYADLTQPNNILGYHYIDEAKKMGSPMSPHTIQRIAANYHDPIDKGLTIASATGIRQAFFEEGSMKEIANYMPVPSLLSLQEFNRQYHAFGSWEQFYPMLRYSILKERPAQLKRFSEVTEGIENLIFEAAAKEHEFEGFIGRVKSKRFTRTRIQRMLTHIYTGFTWDQLRSFQTPSYLRLLGMSEKGKRYLNQQKKNMGLPLISRAANLTDPMGKLDIHASSMYLLGIGAKDLKKEFTSPPLYFG
ncbi:nucleotidyltransferase [Planococcus shenhongbingii]|uniref:tRNA(Met) cytidine acetate ligase n=1 Tax=Planococcus shenhongbingii TaxID=3058398 RepID=A0ABT8N8S7_9BACL|nr:nucleotidyltransferase [Planococcus sp. N017]MDN7244286.1 nucleotidyltransferase [Planococcus sp. N017]